MSDLTQLIEAAHKGDRQAAAALLPLVYEEVRALAVARLAAEAPGQTLNTTALVHEAYLRLVGEQLFDGRGHFFAAAAEAMRRILIEAARRKAAVRHGGGRRRVPLQDYQRIQEEPEGLLAPEDFVAVKFVLPYCRMLRSGDCGELLRMSPDLRELQQTSPFPD